MTADLIQFNLRVAKQLAASLGATVVSRQTLYVKKSAAVGSAVNRKQTTNLAVAIRYSLTKEL
jgi:hypothetical protein